tara:strand:+ start:15467 stop:15973 length:507 start_codon:yes stop_codon:yes gene_type:complete
MRGRSRKQELRSPRNYESTRGVRVRWKNRRRRADWDESEPSSSSEDDEPGSGQRCGRPWNEMFTDAAIITGSLVLLVWLLEVSLEKRGSNLYTVLMQANHTFSNLSEATKHYVVTYSDHFARQYRGNHSYLRLSGGSSVARHRYHYHPAHHNNHSIEWSNNTVLSGAT